jgi:hypothetical protein
MSAASPSHPVEGTDSMSEVIALYRKDVDVSLLRSRLAMTVDERFRDVMRMQLVVEELRRAGAAHREASQ